MNILEGITSRSPRTLTSVVLAVGMGYEQI
jgi:hypothetical protein